MLGKTSRSECAIEGGNDSRPNATDSAQWRWFVVPGSRLVIIADGHLVSEQAPTEHASIILDSITGNRP